MKSKKIKREVNRRRRDGESTKQAAKRLVSDSTTPGELGTSIKTWMTNKKPKKRGVKPKAPPAVTGRTDTNSVSKKRK